MSAASELQAALVATLSAAEGIAGIATGVFDAPPARAAYPYLSIGEGLSLDWSTKNRSGREHRVAITAWDEARRTARLMTLADAIERTIEALPPDLPTNRIASIVLLRSRVVRTAGGPWAALVEYRIRTFQN